MLTPEQIAKPHTEHAEQSALFAWAARYHSLRFMHAIPNGGDRDIIVAGRLKAEGVKPGVFDIFLPVACNGRHGCYIEMKKPSRRNERKAGKWTGGVSDDQRTFGLAMHENGYHTAVCWSWEEARDVIIAYMGTSL